VSGRPFGIIWLLASVLGSAGCATRPAETYMVMPEGGGKSGTVAVTLNDGTQQVLHGDYSAMAVGGDHSKTYVGDQNQLDRTFGSTMAALPLQPLSEMLFFHTGTDELSADSKAILSRIYQGFLQRHSSEIWIIGHTDTVGPDAYNDPLSLRRAESAQQALVKMGVPPQEIVTKGMGKRDLLVATPENTNERRNRRVEISVR
jgi:outer membrane protein OmpA-like peptidoglycan-associated protein